MSLSVRWESDLREILEQGRVEYSAERLTGGVHCDLLQAELRDGGREIDILVIGNGR